MVPRFSPVVRPTFSRRATLFFFFNTPSALLSAPTLFYPLLDVALYLFYLRLLFLPRGQLLKDTPPPTVRFLSNSFLPVRFFNVTMIFVDIAAIFSGIAFFYRLY